MNQRVGQFFLFLILLGLVGGILGQWYLSVGFDPRNPAWWQWLWAASIHPEGLPDELLKPAFLTAIVAGLLFVVVGFLMTRARNETMSGGHKSKNLYGSARWAKLKDIKKARLLRKAGVVVGGFPAKLGKILELRDNSPSHVMAFAPTRTGKGVSLIIATLLRWRSSSVTLDIKGENYAKTAGWLAKLGNFVVRFEPTAIDPTNTMRFNPLAEVRTGTMRDVADCQNIANMVIDPDGKGLYDYWRQEGWGWLSVVLLHVIYKVRKEEQRIACFDDVNTFLSGIMTVEPPAEAIESAREGASKETQATENAMAAEDNFVKILNGMAAYDHGSSHVNKVVRGGANSLAIMAPQQRSGVHGNAKTQLTLYADPIIARNTAVSDFKLSDIMNGDKPMSLFLVFSPSDIARIRPLIRIMLNMFLRRLTEEMEFGEGSKPKSGFKRLLTKFSFRRKGGNFLGGKGYKYKLLLMLDELISTGKLDVFEESLAFLAGYGIRCYIIIQDIKQLFKTYGKDTSIMGNCHIRTAFVPNDPETAEHLAKMLGKVTVVQRRRSQSGKSGQMSGSVSDNIHETSRDLMTADEIMRIPMINIDPDGIDKPKPGDMLIFVGGQPPIYGKQRLYFLDPELDGQSSIRPPKMPDFSNTPVNLNVSSTMEKTHEAA
ncbi:type IV secretory system conjugative DNA transfer family protein [Thalassospira sp.]|uniref:type IV secretory system conjugative DNA transfer family protein n=1 Tax=Thalassospira sp. TaxID=1912094 RepID=UPI0027339563|nr:type IV secretory system conjugative DNA transfer family protein [Thalassospira sp.]MDP2699926.1 type IV secretory system conjugative DNA transfer family protein [Thalassospira sp.]